MCGEKSGRMLRLSRSLGSPPRVRGKDEVKTPNGTHKGITPACAGKREGDGNGESRKRDHPRVCGEKSAIIAAIMGYAGSPPRVRGKVVNARVFGVGRGITPACAGKRRGKEERVYNG